MNRKVTVAVKLGRKYNGEEICNCIVGERRPIDRGQRCYVNQTTDFSFTPGGPDKIRVLACDRCNGAILHKGRLQILDI